MLGYLKNAVMMTSFHNVKDSILGPNAENTRVTVRREVENLLKSLTNVVENREEKRKEKIDAILRRCENGGIMHGEGRDAKPMTPEEKKAFDFLFKRLVVAFDQYCAQGKGPIAIETNPNDKYTLYLDFDSDARYNDIALFNRDKETGLVRRVMGVAKEIIPQTTAQESSSSEEDVLIVMQQTLPQNPLQTVQQTVYHSTAPQFMNTFQPGYATMTMDPNQQLQFQQMQLQQQMQQQQYAQQTLHAQQFGTAMPQHDPNLQLQLQQQYLQQQAFNEQQRAAYATQYPQQQQFDGQYQPNFNGYNGY